MKKVPSVPASFHKVLPPEVVRFLDELVKVATELQSENEALKVRVKTLEDAP